MNIDSIKDGIVIDHITAGNAMRIYNLLGFDKLECSIAIIKNVSRKILTSATNLCEIPDFVSLQNVKTISFLDENAQLRQRLKVTRVNSSSKDKLLTLQHLLLSLSEGKNIERTIIFVNYR